MARRALGERRFTAAYAHGAALGLDTVVREAVYEIGEAAGPRGGDAGAPGDPVAAVGAGAGGAGGGVVGAVPGLLTRREREIAELVASGLSNREIANRLFISKRTVDAHVEHIFGKLEISSRVQLTVLLQDQAPRARSAWA
jgi:DNA-binding CsgD family transcriptional regulator